MAKNEKNVFIRVKERFSGRKKKKFADENKDKSSSRKSSRAPKSTLHFNGMPLLKEFMDDLKEKTAKKDMKSEDEGHKELLESEEESETEFSSN